MLHSVLMTFSRPSVAAILLLLLGITHPDVIYQASAADEDRKAQEKPDMKMVKYNFAAKKWLPAKLQHLKGYRKQEDFKIYILL